MADEKTTAIVVPMYQEQGNIFPLIEAVHKLRKTSGLNVNLIAVNDGSTDKTGAELHEAQNQYSWIKTIEHEKNQGMAQALKTGIQVGLDTGYKIFVFMDGDLTHDPQDVLSFLRRLEEGYDFVIGSRYIEGGGMVGVPLFRVVISQLGNIAGRVLLRLPVRDLTSGYRAIRSSVFEKIEVEETGFGIQMEELVKAYVAGFKLAEVPIVLQPRKAGESKMFYSFNFFSHYARLLIKMLLLRYRA